MKFSARKPLRKWSCGGWRRGHWPIVVLLAVVITNWAAAAAPGRHAIPLPQPRPAQAPTTGSEGKAQKPEDTPAEAEKPAAEAPPQPSPPSPCRLALTESIAIAPSIPPIAGPGSCGGDDLVRLEAIVLPDSTRVAVKPAAVLRCAMASAIADWIRSDIAPLAEAQKTRVGELDNFDSFECRGRNRVAGAKMSEHGRANALDVRALKLANGASISLTDRTVPRELRETVLHSVCARFTTVLGPGSDGYHEDHIHLDLAERRGGYRICQWDVWDPLPQIAPLLPAERPDEAPPREVADKADARPAAAPAETETARPDDENADPPAEKPKPKAESKPKPRKHHASPRPFSLFR